jgi:hypothetical protein
MPTKKKPVSNAFRRIEEYSSLKELALEYQDLKSQWYRSRNLSPRVGRPVEQVDRVQVEAAINAITARYEDKALSGTMDETGRPGYKALLDAAKAKQCDIVLVDDFSRCPAIKWRRSKYVVGWCIGGCG